MSTVSLSEFTPKWDELFNETSDQIHEILGSKYDIQVAHTGSTAMKLLSKPIIQAMVGVKGATPIKHVANALERKGKKFGIARSDMYGYMKDELRLEKVRRNAIVAQIPILPYDNNTWKQRTLFRDYLLLFPDKAAAYVEFKKGLTCLPRVQYQLAKYDFIKTLTEEAFKHFGIDEPVLDMRNDWVVGQIT